MVHRNRRDRAVVHPNISASLCATARMAAYHSCHVVPGTTRGLDWVASNQGTRNGLRGTHNAQRMAARLGALVLQGSFTTIRADHRPHKRIVLPKIPTGNNAAS